jgi:hypothetical protein
MADKDAISVRNDGRRQPVKMIYLLHKCFGHSQSSEWMFESNEVTVLRKAINHNENAVITLRGREAFDKVQ